MSAAASKPRRTSTPRHAIPPPAPEAMLAPAEPSPIAQEATLGIDSARRAHAAMRDAKNFLDDLRLDTDPLDRRADYADAHEAIALALRHLDAVQDVISTIARLGTDEAQS